MTQNTSHAVMAQRGTPAKGLDFFPTPPWATRAGAEIIKALDPPATTCWEPACGAGHMAEPLVEYFPEAVFASDVHDYGFGWTFDFLSDRVPDPCCDWVITNPPFRLGEAFVRAAWPLARRGVAMLLRLAFLEGGARHRLLYDDCPLSVLAPFSERVPMVAGRWDPDASSATAYAWFIFLRGSSPDGSSREQRGTPAPIIVPIPPGTRSRLHRRADVARWCVAEGALL